MEKVVVSLGGSVLVPGDDDARYLRDVARLFLDGTGRVQSFVVSGGGGVARYYIETGRSVGIRERTLDEFGIAVTRLNARLLSAALGGRANREPATSYAAASKLSRRYPIVVMGGTRPGHTTDRVAASLARFGSAARIVNATSVDGVYGADPKKDPDARPHQRNPCCCRGRIPTDPGGGGLVAVRGCLLGTRSLLPRIFEASALPRSRARAYGCFRAEPRCHPNPGFGG